MAAVVEATGIQKGGLYRHFESREALTYERPQTCRFASGPPRGSRKLGSGPAFP